MPSAVHPFHNHLHVDMAAAARADRRLGIADLGDDKSGFHAFDHQNRIGNLRQHRPGKNLIVRHCGNDNTIISFFTEF